MPFDWPGTGASVPVPGVNEKEQQMSLKKYDVEVNGFPTTLLLSDEDANELGLKSTEDAPAKKAVAKKAPAKKAAAKPANKSRTAANKQD